MNDVFDAADRTARQSPAHNAGQAHGSSELGLQGPFDDPSLPDPVLNLNDWDVPLTLLQELYMGDSSQADGSSSSAVTVQTLGLDMAHLTMGSAAPPSSSIAHQIPPPRAFPGSSPTPSTPQRIRTVSNSSSSSVGIGLAAPDSGGLRRAASNVSTRSQASSGHNRTRSQHADTPRHATVTRHRSMRSGGGSGGAHPPMPPGAAAAVAQLGSSPSSSGGGAAGGLALSSWSSGNGAPSARNRVTSNRQKIMSYSPAQRAPYLPVRVLGFEQKKRVLVTGG